MISRLLFAIGVAYISMNQQQPSQSVPVATQWTLDAAGPTQLNAIKSVFMLICPTTGSKGTGFLMDSGVIVTAEHVVRGCPASQVIGVDAASSQLSFAKLVVDADKDLAALRPSNPLSGGLSLAKTAPALGAAVSTWGFPLAYNGPAPLLSVGYMSGFNAVQIGKKAVKHFVVNGAFNPGNSGGPLFQAGDSKVIGVVVSKHVPLTTYVASALDVLAKNESGVLFEATDNTGKKTTFVESQIVAQVLEYYRSLAQVMIGEAVALEELRDFLSTTAKNL